MFKLEKKTEGNALTHKNSLGSECRSSGSQSLAQASIVIKWFTIILTFISMTFNNFLVLWSCCFVSLLMSQTYIQIIGGHMFGVTFIAKFLSQTYWGPYGPQGKEQCSAGTHGHFSILDHLCSILLGSYSKNWNCMTWAFLLMTPSTFIDDMNLWA